MSEDKDKPTTGTGNRHGKPYSKADDVAKVTKTAHDAPDPKGKHRKGGTT